MFFFFANKHSKQIKGHEYCKCTYEIKELYIFSGLANVCIHSSTQLVISCNYKICIEIL